MIPVFLQDLGLDTALLAHTPDVSKNIMQSNKSEHVVDLMKNGLSCFVTPTRGQKEDAQNKYFEIKDDSCKDFALLQIDHGIINTVSRCDCAIVDKDDFCFIEFKANATSLKSKQLKINYKKAMKQLHLTIEIFNKALAAIGNNLFTQRHIESYVCFRRGYPRITSSEINYTTKFAEENNNCPLYFTHTKVLR